MSVIRIASTSYLNALPLSWGFTNGPFREMYDISFHNPADCADLLERGKTDVALIPSIEYQRIAGIRILPGIAVASKGRVNSVILVSKVRFEAISSVAVDQASRTAVTLLRILLRERGFHQPRFTSMPADLNRMLLDHDAALIIGDAALRAATGDLQVFDLAWEWRALTGLPFVFAFWAARPGSRMLEEHRPFLASRRIGLAAIDQIARAHAEGSGLRPAEIAKYLRVNIHYYLGSQEQQSLELFFRKARENSLIPAIQEITFQREDTQEGLQEAMGTQ